MLNRIFGANTHSYLHVLGLSGLAFGLPLNKVVMSVSMMFLVLNLLLEADFKTYFERIRNNRLFLLIAAFFAWHAISLLWSADVSYGVHDLKVKLPLFIVPLVLSARPVEKKTYLNLILFAFLSAVLITSVINFGSYNQWFGERVYDDIRGMSLFSSHVRYALLIVMSVAILIHFFITKTVSVFILIPLFLWLNFYTYYSQILSGAMALGGIYVISLFYWIWKKQKILAFSGVALILVATVLGLLWLIKPITYNPEDYTYKALGYNTTEGHGYYHKPSIVSPETGKPIDIYICDIELKREWEKASEIPYDGKDIKGQHIRRTLIRYMASLDLKKDAEGFRQLTAEDIKSIEKGHASVNNKGLYARILGLKFQLNNRTDPNGHSFLQRLEYWETGIQIARKNWLIGVGNGDVQDSFNAQYEKNNSQLTEENRDRAHNMYLTVLLSLGIPGLLLLLTSHLYFFSFNFQHERLIAVSFMVILLISYLVEDTLETQTGVTFFALFYGLFSQIPKKQSIS